MTYTCFEVNISARIAHIVLNRPEKRNSMIAAFWHELPVIIRDIDDHARARVIVISSTGPHFSSGLDVGMFKDADAKTDEERRHDRLRQGAQTYNTVKRMQETFSVLENCRIPVLACVQGGVIGGGVDLITACDMRFATEDAFITIFETNIGMTADVGTFPRIARLMPDGIARELAYTGRNMPASEARQFGLFNALYPDPESMLEGAMEVARTIAGKAPLAVYGCKRMMNYASDHSTADCLDYIAIWNASMFQKEEIAEAMAANAEKRAADFVDLPGKQLKLE